jgi:hypothetical protein
LFATKKQEKEKKNQKQRRLRKKKVGDDLQVKANASRGTAGDENNFGRHEAEGEEWGVS